MKSKICCFAGHKDCYDDPVKKLIEKAVEIMIEQEKVREFWVGNYGGFDRVSAYTIRNFKSKYPDIKLNLVIPYFTQGINEIKEGLYNYC